MTNYIAYLNKIAGIVYREFRERKNYKAIHKITLDLWVEMGYYERIKEMINYENQNQKIH